MHSVVGQHTIWTLESEIACHASARAAEPRLAKFATSRDACESLGQRSMIHKTRPNLLVGDAHQKAQLNSTARKPQLRRNS